LFIYQQIYVFSLSFVLMFVYYLIGINCVYRQISPNSTIDYSWRSLFSCTTSISLYIYMHYSNYWLSKVCIDITI